MAEQAFHKYDQIEKIERVEKVDPTTSSLDVASAEEVSAPQKVKFDEAVNRADARWSVENSNKTNLVAAEDPVQKLSPIDEMSIGSNKIDRVKSVTVAQIVEQAEKTRASVQTPIARIEEVQNARPDTRISPAHDALLTDKLIHVDSSLKTALNKVGVEVTAQEIHDSVGQKPLVKFLNMLSNSDRQLFTLVGEINALQATNERLTPEKLLAVQIKLSFVQQELEFFTNVLNKALEGTKTVMNVQV